MQLAGIEVVAVSVGGMETCIELPGYDLCFDIGRCPQSAIRRSRVLLTHTHMDHAGGLPAHAATRDLMGLSPPVVYCPRENEADLHDMLEAWRRLDKSRIPLEIVGCGPGDRLRINGAVTAVPFRSPHRTTCQGYALRRTTRRLRADLAGMPEPEVRRRRLAGEVVSEEVEAVEVVFSGDAMIEIVEREEAVRTARLLILECTFLDDRVPVHKARGSGHIHLDELIERAELFQNHAILLTHFSARYTRTEIQRILEARLPAGLRERVTPLLPPA